MWPPGFLWSTDQVGFSLYRPVDHLTNYDRVKSPNSGQQKTPDKLKCLYITLLKIIIKYNIYVHFNPNFMLYKNMCIICMS